MSHNRAFRGLVFLIGLALLAAALWQIYAAQQGLEITSVRSTTPPLTIITPAGAAPGSRPLVLIAHGLAGSGTVMRAFAFTLAHAGYATVSWDFDGHGGNANTLGVQPLIANAEAALAEATARGLAVDGRVAILGHSMGSGVALEFGVTHPDTAATIAVSPTGYTVTAELPHNLLLMAGTYEPNFAANANNLLAQAGGEGGDPAAGTARKFTLIQGVEHMSILFAPAAHHEAVAWLDSTFGAQEGATPYTDVRMAWYALGVLAALLIAAALGSLLWPPVQERVSWRHRGRPLWQRVAALAAGAAAAGLVLWLAEQAGFNVRSLFGILVGGYVMLWFAIGGLVSLVLLHQWPGFPGGRALVGGLLAFAALWLGVGLLAEFVWYPWLLIWPRLRLWPLATLLLLPWFLAVGQVVGGSGLGSQLGRWLVHSVVLVAGLLYAIWLTPAVGFMILLLPALPALFLIHALAAAPHRGSWPFALSGALFTSWMLLALFPLQ